MHLLPLLARFWFACRLFILRNVKRSCRRLQIAFGAQDVSAYQAGAYTGEISPAMLADFSCKYVIVGHSERRAYHHESNELVAQKSLQALRSNICPIVCVGETLEQREAGKTSEVVVTQLRAVMDVLDDGALARIVVAYEPVWAIGTGKTATPQMAQDVHVVLRNTLAERSVFAAEKVRILYGGSMKPDNAKELLAMPDIDGGLIGGASLKAIDFLSIVLRRPELSGFKGFEILCRFLCLCFIKD